MKRLATLYSGAHSERLSLKRQASERYISETIYLLDLPDADLSRSDGLIVPEGLNHTKLELARSQLLTFMSSGGTVFLFGDQPTEWLPGVRWHFDVAGQPEPENLLPENAGHIFHRSFEPTDFFHQHGFFLPPDGAKVLMRKRNGNVVVYEDTVSTGGRLFVTSLDLMHHVDGFFGNPVSRKFFDRFVLWAAEEYL
ncbi:MAG: hypothetical protein AAF234_18600 [Pseudomonadota bacterium]